VSSGSDQKVCIWSLNSIKEQNLKNRAQSGETALTGQQPLFRNFEPKASYISKDVLLGCDHTHDSQTFATAGQYVQVWNYERSTPI